MAQEIDYTAEFAKRLKKRVAEKKAELKGKREFLWQDYHLAYTGVFQKMMDEFGMPPKDFVEPEYEDYA